MTELTNKNIIEQIKQFDNHKMRKLMGEVTGITSWNAHSIRHVQKVFVGWCELQTRFLITYKNAWKEYNQSIKNKIIDDILNPWGLPK